MRNFKAMQNKTAQAVEWKEYYKLQYERIQQHESQRVQFSGLVVAGSITALVLLLRINDSVSSDGLAYAAVSISIVNIICIFFVLKSRFWVKFHQKRAHLILKEYQPELTALIIEKGPKKPNSDVDLFSRVNLQIYLHLFLAAFPVILYRCKLGALSFCHVFS